MLNKLIQFQALKTQFPNGQELYRRLETDTQLRKDIEALSRTFLHKTVSGCRNCYADTFHQLMRLNPTQMEEKANCRFQLKPGALLHDVVNFDISLNITQVNITNDKALYHLKTNPACANLFAVLPDDWQQQAAQYQLPATQAEPTPAPKKTRKKKMKNEE